MTRLIEVTVGSASLDEPEVLRTVETAPVRRAIKSLRAACKRTGDGFVEVHEATVATCTESEFLDWAACFIGTDAAQIDALPIMWRSGTY